MATVQLVPRAKLTLGELEEIEQYAGTIPTARFMAGRWSPKVMVAWAWVSLRRTDPAVTIDDVRNLGQLDVELHPDDAPKPPEEGEAADPPR